MAEGYGSHRDYIDRVKPSADERVELVRRALHDAFRAYIQVRQVETVAFAQMSAIELGDAIVAFPLILKPLLVASNIAGRAIERDLNIRNVDTYVPRLSQEQALVIAGYIKPFLPEYLDIPVLAELDRVAFIDKEMRMSKGRWERQVLQALNRFGGIRFQKRKFSMAGEEFELDAAAVEDGVIRVGVDVKRIEARRDIHKRCDEIVNKASKLNAAVPAAKFGAVIYYPFPTEHINIRSRLQTPNIGAVVFASETDDSIETAVRLLLSTLEVTQ